MNFEEAFIQCLKDGIHPGPAEINDRLGRGRRRTLNGQETSLRQQLMYDFGIPYIRGYYKGEIPSRPFFDDPKMPGFKPPGWRKIN